MDRALVDATYIELLNSRVAQKLRKLYCTRSGNGNIIVDNTLVVSQNSDGIFVTVQMHTPRSEKLSSPSDGALPIPRAVWRIDIPHESNYCRAGLYIDQTSLTGKNGNILPIHGLFTSKIIPVGAFLGLYRGAFINKETSKSKNSYAMRTGLGQNIEPPIVNGFVQARSEYPLAMINESVLQNVESRPLLDKSQRAVPSIQKKTKLDGVAFYASKLISPGQELFLNYGPAYAAHRKTYSISKLPTQSLKKQQLELPTDMYLHSRVDPDNIKFGEHYEVYDY